MAEKVLRNKYLLHFMPHIVAVTLADSVPVRVLVVA